MVSRIIVAAALIAVATVIAWRLDRRPGHAAAVPIPVRDRAHVPAQLDRDDFPHPEAAWLLVLFSSPACGGCAEMSTKVAVLETEDVAVCEVDYATRRELQEKYLVDAVPLVLVADSEGVVRAHTFGNVPASDVRATVSRARAAGAERHSPSPDGPVPE